MPIDLTKYTYLQSLSPEVQNTVVTRAEDLINNSGYSEEEALAAVIAEVQDAANSPISDANTGAVESKSVLEVDTIVVQEYEDEENLGFMETDMLDETQDIQRVDSGQIGHVTDSQAEIRDNQNNLDDIELNGSVDKVLEIRFNPSLTSYELISTQDNLVTIEMVRPDFDDIIRKARSKAKQYRCDLLIYNKSGILEDKESYINYDDKSEPGGATIQPN